MDKLKPAQLYGKVHTVSTVSTVSKYKVFKSRPSKFQRNGAANDTSQSQASRSRGSLVTKNFKIPL